MSKAAATPATGPVMLPDVFARDEIIAWFRGEFAAANAIIDALCNHLTQIAGGERRSEYEAVFAAIHRRRMNWIPLLHMQKYFSIADVSAELRCVVSKRKAVEEEEEKKRREEEEEREAGRIRVFVENEREIKEADEDSAGDSSDQKVLKDGGDAGGGSAHTTLETTVQISSDCEDNVTLPDKIKMSKGFVAKEPVKGHMVNVVKGLKLYEDIFTDPQLLRLAEFVNELRLVGRKGELSGETFIFFNKQLKANKREIIQLGVPIFQSTKVEAKSNIEPIPPVLQTIIDHLVQWRLIPESRKPNSCIINFFDEDEFSQPYFKPPHLDNPVSTLVLYETTMAFGRALVSNHNGNYTGSLTLPLKEGSLLVMRGNSADMARHVICPSSNRRVTITFVKVRSTNDQVDPSIIPPLTRAMTLWKPGVQLPRRVSDGAIGYGLNRVVPTWGVSLRSPIVMFNPPGPMVMSSAKRIARSGTGVFLPWTVGSKKYTRHLPPRIQKRRLLSLPPPLETHA